MPTAPRTLGRRSRRGAAVVVGTSEANSPRHDHAGRSCGRAWVVRSRHGNTNLQVKKALALSNAPARGDPHGQRLQVPTKHLSPARGKRVGGVSERPAQDPAEGVILLTPCGRNGGKHPVHGMVSPFAGRHRNVGLGRSDNPQRSPPRRTVAPMTTGALRSPRRGTSSAHALKKRGHPTRGLARHSRQGDASFTRSEGPCTSIVAQPAEGNLHGVTRTATQRGRVNLGNQEEPAPWQRRTDGARLVTHHRRRKACSMMRSRKGRRLAAVVPTRIPRVEVEVPARRSSCRSR